VRDRAPNLVVLTGDIHANWVADLKVDFDDARSPAIGSEFMGTTISSGGDGADMTDFGERGLAANPHIHFFNGQRGYIRCTATRDRWLAEYRVVPWVTRPGAGIATRAAFAVAHERPGVQRA
jgi:alkaline phosphatase D